MGLVTEGSSTNAWIVDETGTLRTRDTHANILRGVTRTTLLKLIEEEGLAFEERAFSVDEAKRAREAFYHLGQRLRDAGGVDRRHEDRERQAGPDRDPKLRALYLDQAIRDAI